jgi:hypothetical protein
MSDDPKTCNRCGQPHAQCTAHNRSGNPCGQKPQPGQRVCHLHGGRSPQAIAAADERLKQRELEHAVETFGLPVEIDHHTALLQELHRTAGAVAWLGTIVAGLEQGDVVWGRTRVKTGGDDAGTTYEAATNAWVLEWQKERRHLVAVAAACAKAGIEERRQALAESQGQLLARVVQVVLAGLDLTVEQQALVPVVVPAAFREIAAGGAV